MSTGEVLLWVLGGVIVIGCLAFIGIFLRFVTKATVSYVRHRPYPALGAFAGCGGLATFIAAFAGARFELALIIGLVVGTAVLLLVAIELGTD